MSKKERKICKFEMDLKNFFCLHFDLSNDYIISALRPDLKTGMDFRGLGLKRSVENYIFGLKSAFWVAHPLQEFPGVLPPPPPGGLHVLKNYATVEIHP